MTFWAYMLQCRGGFLYVGQTADLARRIAQHDHGQIQGYTRDHLPVALVWSQELPSRDEAKAAERQIKGWSRAKKLALIRGDWESISKLGKKRGSPSTSSGWTVGGAASSHAVHPEPVQGLSLLAPHPELALHPDKPPLCVTLVRAKVTAITEHWLTLRWSVAGTGKIILPRLTGNRRADDLWRHTCFEIFLRTAGSEAYLELNLSPSESWAAYDFTGYRAGMADRPMPRQPVCTARIGSNTLIFDAAVPLACLPPLPWRVGLTAVIEEEGGVMSYWSLAHPQGPPDFHHPACLALAVPAPQAP